MDSSSEGELTGTRLVAVSAVERIDRNPAGTLEAIDALRVLGDKWLPALLDPS